MQTFNWTKIKDKRPPTDKTLTVFTKCGRLLYDCVYLSKEKLIFHKGDYFTATHWMIIDNPED